VPSATAALALARAFQCPVEDLFSLGDPAEPAVAWASPPPPGPCRYWQADLGPRRILFPADAFADVDSPHDGVFDGATLCPSPQADPQRTLVLATCDPAAGLLAHELARTTQIRLLVIPRSSRRALELLRAGLVHVAGLHLSSASEDGNAAAVAECCGAGGRFNLIRAARWEEGLALAPGRRLRSVRSALGARLRWIGRDAGSGAQQCLVEVRGNRPAPRSHACSHRGVAEAIRAGFVDAGICLRLVSDQAGLDFLPVREEAYDLCFSADDAHDPRIAALIDAIQSPAYRKLLGELPGYSIANAGLQRTVEA